MNQKQKEELLKIVSEDCKTKGVYINKDGDTCAVGAIALAAGVDREVLIRAGTAMIIGLTASVQLMTDSIRRRFGLSEWQLAWIQRANDFSNIHESSPDSVEARRSRVMDAIAQIEVTD